MGEFLTSWMGEAVNWECDELGHLNMRHYAGKVAQARAFLFMHLGLARSFQRGTPSTVRPGEFEICYLREARPGARLSIRSGLTRLGETDAELVHVMEHAHGAVAATIRERVEHVSLRTGEAFAWPSRLRARAPEVSVSGDEHAPRGLERGATAEGPDRAGVLAMGCDRVGAGVFRTDETDLFGRVTVSALMGRCSESVGNFRRGWPEAYGPGGLYDPEREGPARLSGVLLELRVFLHARAEAGQAYEVFSGLKSANPSVRHLVHHVVDPVSGASFASMSATSAVIDLTERRLVKLDPEGLEALLVGAEPGVRP